jgi:hypothetical protein
MVSHQRAAERAVRLADVLPAELSDRARGVLAEERELDGNPIDRGAQGELPLWSG